MSEWQRCREPCAFGPVGCTHLAPGSRQVCGKPHTHYRRIAGMIQDNWPVACDEHAT